MLYIYLFFIAHLSSKGAKTLVSGSLMYPQNLERGLHLEPTSQ